MLHSIRDLNKIQITKTILSLKHIVLQLLINLKNKVQIYVNI